MKEDGTPTLNAFNEWLYSIPEPPIPDDYEAAKSAPDTGNGPTTPRGLRSPAGTKPPEDVMEDEPPG